MKFRHQIVNKEETIEVSSNVTIHAVIDTFDRAEWDTSIELKGEFSVMGNERKEFYEKLGNLIDEYRI